MKNLTSGLGSLTRIETISVVGILAILSIGVIASTQETSINSPLANSLSVLFGSGQPDEENEELQLSKEYLRVDGHLLAVEEKGASPTPPTDLAVWRASSGTWWVIGGTGSQQQH